MGLSLLYTELLLNYMRVVIVSVLGADWENDHHELLEAKGATKKDEKSKLECVGFAADESEKPISPEEKEAASKIFDHNVKRIVKYLPSEFIGRFFMAASQFTHVKAVHYEKELSLAVKKELNSQFEVFHAREVEEPFFLNDKFTVRNGFFTKKIEFRADDFLHVYLHPSSSPRVGFDPNG